MNATQNTAITLNLAMEDWVVVVVEYLPVSLVDDSYTQ